MEQFMSQKLEIDKSHDIIELFHDVIVFMQQLRKKISQMQQPELLFSVIHLVSIYMILHPFKGRKVSVRDRFL